MTKKKNKFIHIPWNFSIQVQFIFEKSRISFFFFQCVQTKSTFQRDLTHIINHDIIHITWERFFKVQKERT